MRASELIEQLIAIRDTWADPNVSVCCGDDADWCEILQARYYGGAMNMAEIVVSLPVSECEDDE